MHICYVTSTYPPDNGWGGIGTYVYHIARAMMALGHQVTVLCGSGDRGEYEAEIGGVYVVRRLGQETGGPLELASQVANVLDDLVDRRRVDLVEFAEYGALGIQIQRCRPGLATVVRFHSSSDQCADDLPLWKKAAAYLLRHGSLTAWDSLERESTSRAYAVTSCCQWAVDTYRRRGWQWRVEPEVILNPISSPLASADATRDPIGVVMFGRVEARKGADLLPETAHRVWAKRPQTRFHIYGQDRPRSGGGSWVTWLRDALGDTQGRVVFHGGVAHADVHHVLLGYRYAFFASTWEFMPYSHIEAMQAGIACVNASGAGAAELGEHMVHLWRCGRHPDEIAEGLLRLMSDDALAARMGAAAQERIRTEFGIETVGQRMDKVYQGALARANGE